MLIPDRAVFIEERYIRPLFCKRLSTICATRAAIPHVEVAQDFQAFVTTYKKNNDAAKKDTQGVFELLNDDGTGINNKLNTAVGYRLARVADLFMLIAELPADNIKDIDEGTPVDMPGRFTPAFVDSQLRIGEKPVDTGNYIFDMISKLRYVQLMMSAISDFVEVPLASNARTIYATNTHSTYLSYSTEIIALCKDVIKKSKKSIQILEKHADIEYMEVINEMEAELINDMQTLKNNWVEIVKNNKLWCGENSNSIQENKAKDQPWWIVEGLKSKENKWAKVMELQNQEILHRQRIK